MRVARGPRIEAEVGRRSVEKLRLGVFVFARRSAHRSACLPATVRRAAALRYLSPWAFTNYSDIYSLYIFPRTLASSASSSRSPLRLRERDTTLSSPRALTPAISVTTDNHGVHAAFALIFE